MKAIGVTQLLQKKFTFLQIHERWKGLLGALPASFNGIIYGSSGNGKSELSIQLAKELALIDGVGWLGYEQGHDADLQMAVIRNNMDEVKDNWRPIDPMEKLPAMLPGEEMPDLLFRDIDRYIGRRNSPRFFFFDSLDYTGFTFEHYKRLKEKHKKKKGFIWVSHAKGKEPKTQVAKDIKYDGQFGIYVKDYVAYPSKSRLGGKYPYIIHPEEVKRRIELNPKSYPPEVHQMINEMYL